MPCRPIRPSSSSISCKQFGETRRGWLGVKIQSITDDIAETLGVKENTGALISSVTPEGPAAKAGIEAGDVVVRFDGKDVSTMRGLPRIVSQAPVGKTVDVEILRKGQKKIVKVVIGRLQEDDDKDAKGKSDKSAPTTPDGSAKPSSNGLSGVTVQPMSDELRAKYKIDPKVKGVVVTEVDPKSPAGQKNIKAGDVIVEAAQDAVSTPEDIAKSIEKVRKAGRKQLLLRVENAKGEMRFVAVAIE